MPEELKPTSSNVVPLEQDTSSIDTSEIDLSEMFARRFCDNLRYVGQWSRWLWFNGKKWEPDHKMQTYARCKAQLKQLALRIFKAELAAEVKFIDTNPNISETDRKSKRKAAKKRAVSSVKHLKYAKTVSNVIWLARPDPQLISGIDEWDANPWLLNTPQGTVDLKSGRVRPHDAADYMSMITAASPSAMVPHKWLEFIRTITDGDSDLAEYLQRVLGYCLTGHTGEHAMFFGFGTGANGKSVILNTMGKLLGDYHKSTAMETFILTSEYRHPTELASLRGARMVTASETQKGRRWDEVKVKRLTGGDVITARFMRQDFFEYYPQFKLFIAGNHKPSLGNVDEAMRRRFNLIPFTVTIPEHQRDPYLVEKLEEEWGGILGWMLDGCLAWQSQGLKAPACVREATDTYMAMEDTFTSWYSECCTANINSFELIKDLYDSWCKWAEHNQERKLSKADFSNTLSTRGEILKIRYRKLMKGRGFEGIELLQAPK